MCIILKISKLGLIWPSLNSKLPNLAYSSPGRTRTHVQVNTIFTESSSPYHPVRCEIYQKINRPSTCGRHTIQIVQWQDIFYSKQIIRSKTIFTVNQNNGNLLHSLLFTMFTFSYLEALNSIKISMGETSMKGIK